jgi:hypothetical protein
MFPWFKVYPKLKDELEFMMMLVTKNTIEHCKQFTHYIGEEGDTNILALLNAESSLRAKIETMISELWCLTVQCGGTLGGC